MAADCKRSRCIRFLETSVALIRRTARRREANRRRIRFCAGRHERLFLFGDQSAAAGHGGNDRVPRTNRAGSVGRTNDAQSGEPIGYIFAFANCALFVLYILLGHRIAASGGRGGVERLAMAMVIASIVVTPIGLRSAAGALLDPKILLAGAGVGICSSVIPYICDQFAMARLSKATFAFMLSLLPATACLVGIVVLRQVPSLSELTGVGAVIAGVALKRSVDDQRGKMTQ